MSNINDEKNDGLGQGFFKNLGKIQERNAQDAKIVEAWEQDAGLKPPREDMPKILTEQEMQDKAKAMTQNQNDEQEKLEKMGLTETQQQGSRRKFADKMEQEMGADAVKQAREEARQEQEHEAKHEQGRDV